MELRTRDAHVWSSTLGRNAGVARSKTLGGNTRSRVKDGGGQRLLLPTKGGEFVTNHPGQLSLLPSVKREMCTGESAVMLCGWE